MSPSNCTSAFSCHLDFTSCISRHLTQTFSKRQCLDVLLFAVIWLLTKICSLIHCKNETMQENYHFLLKWIFKHILQAKRQRYQTIVPQAGKHDWVAPSRHCVLWKSCNSLHLEIIRLSPHYSLFMDITDSSCYLFEALLPVWYFVYGHISGLNEFCIWCMFQLRWLVIIKLPIFFFTVEMKIRKDSSFSSQPSIKDFIAFCKKCSKVTVHLFHLPMVYLP